MIAIGAPLIGWVAQLLGARGGLLTDGAIVIAATLGVVPPLLRRRPADRTRRSASPEPDNP